ncbi:hypothetical protein QWZ06_26275 [Chryseobacterium tructae]|uniref:Uncharacterized protein n=1 Tax=Chryseobacterium tructae TaxID=1037380 RepID=A0ABV7XRH8_9FLAO|nr:hypothetical protein [Chryseobacterium tructae]MDN3695485.1 hypothetical protein [Chryseobacterium tructae]
MAKVYKGYVDSVRITNRRIDSTEKSREKPFYPRVGMTFCKNGKVFHVRTIPDPKSKAKK